MALDNSFIYITLSYIILPEFTADATSFLIEQYTYYTKKLNPMAEKNKIKHVWEQICKDVNAKFETSFSIDQCRKRFYNVRKKHNEAELHNSKSGNNPIDVPFEREFYDYKQFDDSMKPEVLISPRRLTILKDANPSAMKKTLCSPQATAAVAPATKGMCIIFRTI